MIPILDTDRLNYKKCILVLSKYINIIGVYYYNIVKSVLLLTLDDLIHR